VSRVSPSRYRSTHPQKNATPNPSISKYDTERKFTIIYGINNTSTTSRKPPDSSYNLTLPNPFTTSCESAPLSTKQSKYIFESLRNIDLIHLICREAPLFTNHASMYLNNGHPLPKGLVIRENSLLNFLANSTTSTDVDTFGSRFFFVLFRC
jgi:hypothetical protein